MIIFGDGEKTADLAIIQSYQLFWRINTIMFSHINLLLTDDVSNWSEKFKHFSYCQNLFWNMIHLKVFLDRHSKKLNVIFITKPLSNVISKYMVVTLFSLHLKQISKYLPGE